MPYTVRERLDQVYILAAIWTETLFYGFYVCLFVLAMHVLLKPSPSGATRERASSASKVFFGTLILMFMIATLHMIIQMYRLTRAYGWIIGPKDTPISYYHSVPGWDTTANNVVLGLMIWVGDALVIYRCWIIWARNFYVVILPILLWLATIACHITLYVWWDTKFTTFMGILPVVDMIYPINFAQNLITTGLIAYKIIRQHRMSQQSGLEVRNRVSLLHVARILVESASLYTIELLIIIILYFSDHPLQFVVQAAIIPSIGIVFVLIAIRIHLARSESQSNTMVSHSVIPPWLSDHDPVFRAGTTHGGNSTASDNSHALQILGPRKPGNGVFVHQETSTHDTKAIVNPV